MLAPLISAWSIQSVSCQVYGLSLISHLIRRSAAMHVQSLPQLLHQLGVCDLHRHRY